MRRLLLALLLAVPASALADATVQSKELFPPLSVSVLDDQEVDRFFSQIGQWLEEDRRRVVRIEVHADERLGTIDNTYLADKRAKDLAKAIRKAGGRKRQIYTDAVGHTAVEPSAATSRVVFDFVGGEPELTLP